MSDPRFVKFGDEANGIFSDLGLFPNALKKIFLGDIDATSPPSLIAGCPKMASGFHSREFHAAEWMYKSIKDKCVVMPSPYSGRPAILTACTSHFRANVGLQFIAIRYCFSDDDMTFCAGSCGLTGRINYIYIPNHNLIIFDHSENLAKAMHNEFNKEDLCSNINKERKLEKFVGILDMVTNFGHQMINHLSGFDRLIAAGVADGCSEIWVTGNSFFGNMEDLYPELRTKIKIFSSREEMIQSLNSSNTIPLKIGSNHFFQSTYKRIMSLARENYGAPRPKKHFPLIAVTVRSGGRLCTNLETAIEHFYDRMAKKFPNIGFVIDGFAYKEFEMELASPICTIVSGKYGDFAIKDMQLARSVFAKIPQSAIARNNIGLPILHSILNVSDVDAYISHVGTLQHKVAFFSMAAGVVHGPKSQLSHMEGGAFQAELGRSPLFLSESDVTDIPGETPRGAPFFDYRIDNIENISRKILEIVQPGQSGDK